MNMFDLKIGFKCNNDCRHCVVANKRNSGNLSLEQLKDIISNIDPSIDVLVITGGEPSISENLLDILRYAKDRGLLIQVQTNATGFVDIDFCKECSKYIDHAHVAIHSNDPGVHDNIVRSKGMWQKTMDGFQNLLSNGVYCTTQTVLSKYNIMTVYDTYKMIQEIKPGTCMSFTYPHLMGNALNNYKDVAFRYSDYKEEMHRIFKDFGKNIWLESIPYCYQFPYEKSFEGSVEYEIATHSDIEGRTGIDFSDGFKEKNYNYLDVTSRRKAPKCKDCVFNNICIGVWKEYIEIFKDRLDLYPITEEMYNKEQKC